MMKSLNLLNDIRRPRLLIQAARIGASTYRRETHLRRLLDPGQPPRSDDALALLLEQEAQMNHQRQTNEAFYCAADHVDVLIAMMGEARLLRAAYAPLQQVESPPKKAKPM
ncbi:MAG: DUF6477 family protein [Roseovarius sp.]|nr:DUF6477 family protein [Roseovarius sp.]